MGRITERLAGRRAPQRERIADAPQDGRGHGGGALTVAVAAIVAALVLLAAPAAWASSPDVVISEVYLGGGYEDSTYDASFVELFNRSGTAVSLDGWTLQGRRPDGIWFGSSLAGTIEPGRYVLVQLSLPLLGSLPLPLADRFLSLGSLQAEGGAIALTTSRQQLTCGAVAGDCATVAAIRDMVGWGTSVAAEGSPANAVTGHAQSLGRFSFATGAQTAPGCRDSDSNSREFFASIPTPVNSLTAAVTCPPTDVAPTVLETIPVNGATDVAPDQPITIRFSEAVFQARATVYCTGLDLPLSLRSDDGLTFTATHPRFRYGDRCSLLIAAGSARDEDSDDPPDGLAADVVVQFTTLAPTEFAALRTTSATLQPGGWLRLNVRCSPQAVTACTGSVVLTIRAAAGSGPARRITIGTGRFVIAYRLQARVGVRLNRLGKEALAARQRLVATATVTSTDAAGRRLTRESTLVVHPGRSKRTP
ncbi:MAG: lamin tail domain-containing protein [Thermoleophilia bacterium]